MKLTQFSYMFLFPIHCAYVFKTIRFLLRFLKNYSQFFVIRSDQL